MHRADHFAVIGGTGNHDLDRHTIEVVNDLGFENLDFMNLNIDVFPDGEQDFRIDQFHDLRDKQLILMQSSYNDDLLIQFLQLAWAAKFQYGVRSITAVVSFLRYRRQDHPEIPEEINRNRWVAQMMAACGVDRIILCDVHSEETIKNMEEVHIEVHNVSSAPAFAAKLRAYVEVARSQGQKFFVYSPDKGSIARAISLARELQVELIVTLKKRLHTGEAAIDDDPGKLEELIAQYHYPLELASREKVAGSIVVIKDDEINTGGTCRLTGWHVRDKLGAAQVICCLTHPVCAPGWKRKFFDNNPFDNIFFGNTIPRNYEKSTGGAITTVHMSQVLGNELFRVMQGLI